MLIVWQANVSKFLLNHISAVKNNRLTKVFAQIKIYAVFHTPTHTFGIAIELWNKQIHLGKPKPLFNPFNLKCSCK